MVDSETSDNTHSGAGPLGRDMFKISRPGTLVKLLHMNYVLLHLFTFVYWIP